MTYIRMMKRAGRRKIIARDSGKQRIDPRTIRINRRERNTWYGGNRGGHTLTKATRKSDARGKPIYTTNQPGTTGELARLVEDQQQQGYVEYSR
jgi:hypothetical protein